MTIPDQQPCGDIEVHSGHMCELESQQEWDIIRQISDQPTFKCQNCGAEVNAARNVCMPEEL